MTLYLIAVPFALRCIEPDCRLYIIGTFTDTLSQVPSLMQVHCWMQITHRYLYTLGYPGIIQYLLHDMFTGALSWVGTLLQHLCQL